MKSKKLKTNSTPKFEYHNKEKTKATFIYEDANGKEVKVEANLEHNGLETKVTFDEPKTKELIEDLSEQEDSDKEIEPINFREYLEEIWNSSKPPRFRGCGCGRKKETHIVKSFLEVRNPFTDGVGRVNENDINEWSNKFELSKEEVKEIIIETVKQDFNVTEIKEYCRVPMFGCHCANVPPLLVDSKTGKRI